MVARPLIDGVGLVGVRRVRRCPPGMTARVLGPCLIGVLLGCTAPEASFTIQGQWGGPHAGLIADANGARIEFDCAGGRVTRPIVVTGDAFDVEGTLTHGGGPVSIDDTTRAEPARYVGRVDGNRITLNLTLTKSGEKQGPFTLIRGRNPNVYKCV